MIRPYTEGDYQTLKAWFESRGRTCPSADLLSKTGFISDSAAGFLYLTNSSIAFADCFVSDVLAPKAQRQSELKAISEAIIELAKQSGVKVIKADSQIDTMVLLSLELKFKSSGTYKSFYKEL